MSQIRSPCSGRPTIRQFRRAGRKPEIQKSSEAPLPRAAHAARSVPPGAVQQRQRRMLRAHPALAFKLAILHRTNHSTPLRINCLAALPGRARLFFVPRELPEKALGAGAAAVHGEPPGWARCARRASTSRYSRRPATLYSSRFVALRWRAPAGAGRSSGARRGRFSGHHFRPLSKGQPCCNSRR